MKTNNIFQKIRHSLFGRANRELLIFLFFFIIAGIFWLMMTLNLNYDKEIKIPVHITDVPQDVVLTSSETDTLHVVINDKGFNLLSYLYGEQVHPIELNYAAYAPADGTGMVTGPDLQKLVVQSLSASSSVVTVKPERLLLYYNYGEQKRVPVRLQGHVAAEQHYFVADTVFSQDSITIYASHDRLDSIAYVMTKPLNVSNIKDFTTINCPLLAIEGVKMVPSSVKVSFTTDILSELSISGIPVVGINLPTDKQLRMYPSKVKVSFVTGLKKYQNLSAEDFEVVADYNEFKDNPSSKCNIYLRRVPDGISRAKLDVNQVDCFIEGNQ